MTRRSSDKRVSGSTGASSDDLERLNENLLKRVEALEILNAELEAFNFSVSHDLRSSLQAILGFSQTLAARHHDELSPEAERFVGLIITGARGMGELIDDLLSFSQVNRVSLEREPVDIGDLVRDALNELEPQLTDRDIEIVFGRLPVVDGDPVLLRRVLVNLLANAIKFTRGNSRARIELGSFEQDGALVVFVRDNGVGFDAELSGRLFRAFERLHCSDEFEGTGVGLALVGRIIDRHGGRIWAESVLGEGATFYFTLGDGKIAGATALARRSSSSK